MRKKSKSLMQSEVFIIIMIIIALLYVIMTMYATGLETTIQNMDSCVELEDLSDKNQSFKDSNPNICIKLKDLNLSEEEEENLTTCVYLEDINGSTEDNLTICVNLKNLKDIDDMNKTIQEMNNSIHDLNKTLAETLGKYIDLNRTLQKNKKPPLITLSEDKKEFRFGAGKALLSAEYIRAFKKEKLKEITESISIYQCDTIEVYGYTDTQALKSKNMNLSIDANLHQCLIDGCSIDEIKFFSNLELGMKRAISIVLFLKSLPELQGLTIKPYSAGQFIDENGKISNITKKEIPKRRRIEIRLSRSKKMNKQKY